MGLKRLTVLEWERIDELCREPLKAALDAGDTEKALGILEEKFRMQKEGIGGGRGVCGRREHRVPPTFTEVVEPMLR